MPDAYADRTGRRAGIIQKNAGWGFQRLTGYSMFSEEDPALNEILKSLKGKYDYADGTYAVVVPESAQDLLHEGDALHHCINWTDHYYEWIVKRESYILFIRKIDQLSVPYYTVEAEPDGTVRQIRTEYNRQKEDFEDISEFMKKWQREIARRLTKSDREKSAASRKFRKQEYEQLRKEQVWIGQGIYEGQLLADILEAGLMEMQEAA